MPYNKNIQSSLGFDKKRTEYNMMEPIKFEILIKDIQKIIGYEWNSLNMVGTKFTNKAVNLMVGESVYNDYIKVLIDNSRLGRIQDWNLKYKQFNFNDRNLKNEAIRDLVIYCRQNIDDAYCYVFWLLLVLAIDKFDYDKRLSYICEFSQIMKISDDEFEDLVNVVKYVCQAQNSNYAFKSEKVKELFGDVMKIYE